MVQQNADGDVDCLAGMCELFNKSLVRKDNGDFTNPNGCPYFDNVRMVIFLYFDPFIQYLRTLCLAQDEVERY